MRAYTKVWLRPFPQAAVTCQHTRCHPRPCNGAYHLPREFVARALDILTSSANDLVSTFRMTRPQRILMAISLRPGSPPIWLFDLTSRSRAVKHWSRARSSADRRCDRIEHILIAKWLSQEIHCAGRRLNRHWDIAMSRHEDDGMWSKSAWCSLG